MSQAVDSSASALAGSRELLAAVLAHLGDGIVVHAPNGDRLYANDAAARLTGFASAEELLAATPEVALARFDVFHADGTPMQREELPGHRALAGEEPAPTLVRYRPAGGGPDRVSQVSAVPVRDAQGELLYVIIHFRDVTDEPVFAAEAAGALENASLYREAKRTSALLDSLYNSAPIGLGFWDRDLRYVRVNNALAVINERPSEDHPGRTFAEVVPHLAPALESIARRVLETSEPVTALEMVAGTPSDPTAQRFWLTSYYPVLDRDGDALGVGAVIEEVTDRRRAEQRTELQHVVTRILSAADAVDTAVTRVLETVCEALGWDVGCYWPLDPEEPRVTWARAGVRADGFLEMTRRMPLSTALLPGRVAESGEAEWLDHLSPPTFPRASVAEAEGLSSGVGFPILIEGQVGGVLEIFSQARRARDPEILQTLVAIGGQLGQFLRRKRAEDERLQLLQRERQARAEAESAAATLRKLARVSEVALDRIGLNELLEALLARIAEVLDADSAAILLLGANGELGVRAAFGLAGALEHARTIPLGAGMAGRVAASRAPAVIADLAEVELVSPVLRERGINSLVAIPLIADDAVIGVVHAGSEAYAQLHGRRRAPARADRRAHRARDQERGPDRGRARGAGAPRVPERGERGTVVVARPRDDAPPDGAARHRTLRGRGGRRPRRRRLDLAGRARGRGRPAVAGGARRDSGEPALAGRRRWLCARDPNGAGGGARRPGHRPGAAGRRHTRPSGDRADARAAPAARPRLRAAAGSRPHSRRAGA